MPGWNKDYPALQILTIAELLSGAEIKMPPEYGTFRQAQQVKPTQVQGRLALDFSPDEEEDEE